MTNILDLLPLDIWTEIRSHLPVPCDRVALQRTCKFLAAADPIKRHAPGPIERRFWNLFTYGYRHPGALRFVSALRRIERVVVYEHGLNPSGYVSWYGDHPKRRHMLSICIVWPVELIHVLKTDYWGWIDGQGVIVTGTMEEAVTYAIQRILTWHRDGLLSNLKLT